MPKQKGPAKQAKSPGIPGVAKGRTKGGNERRVGIRKIRKKEKKRMLLEARIRRDLAVAEAVANRPHARQKKIRAYQRRLDKAIQEQEATEKTLEQATNKKIRKQLQQEIKEKREAVDTISRKIEEKKLNHEEKTLREAQKESRKTPQEKQARASRIQSWKDLLVKLEAKKVKYHPVINPSFPPPTPRVFKLPKATSSSSSLSDESEDDSTLPNSITNSSK